MAEETYQQTIARMRQERSQREHLNRLAKYPNRLSRGGA